MEIDEIIAASFKNTAVDSGFKFKMKRSGHSFFRKDYLCELFMDKKVIHLGCADHKELIDYKLANNTWVHKVITDVAQKCIGFDINEKAIEYIHSKGFLNVDCTDILKNKNESILSESWDYILLGEVLEHIDNPVNFLENIKNKYQSSIKNIVITVPNALRLLNFKYSLKNIEFINSDHRFWFTPYTIIKVVSEAGFIPVNIDMCLYYRPSRLSLIKRPFLKLFPLFCDNIILIARFT